jgi:hypothetical protein
MVFDDADVNGRLFKPRQIALGIESAIRPALCESDGAL